MMMSPFSRCGRIASICLSIGIAGLHHQHHATGPLQQSYEFLDGMRANDLRPFGFVRDELVYFGNRPVEHGNFVAVIIHIEHQVLAHDGQPD